MKKTLTFLLALILLVSLTAACGNSKKEGGAEKGLKTVTIWLPANLESEDKQFAEFFDAYNKANQGKVELKWEFVPRGNGFAYEDKVTSAVASNALPDILMMDGPNVSNYAYSGIIQPIGDYFKKEELSDFVDSAIDQGTYDGKFYALAPTTSTVALFYNKDIMDKNGITPPTELSKAWTWPEFLENVKKVHKAGEVFGVNYSPDYGKGEWMTYMPTPFVWSNEGDIISADGMKADGSINGPATVEAMKYFQELTHTYANPNATPTEFEEGKAAFKIVGSWAVARWKSEFKQFNWGVTFMPYSKKPSSSSGDWAFGVSSQSKDPGLAAEVIKSVLSKDNIAKFSQVSGKPPTSKAAFDKMPEWNEYPGTIFKEQVVNTAHPRPKVHSYPIVTQEFAAAASDIALGAEVQSRLDQAAQNIDQNIERNYKK